MLKFKYLLAGLPLLVILGVLKNNQLKNSTNSAVLKKITPKIVGKWIVGTHHQFNDADTLKLQEAVDNALNGDTILLRPGKYQLDKTPTTDLTIRGLTSEPENVIIEISRPIKVSQKELSLENLSLKNSIPLEFIIFIKKGLLTADNIIIKTSKVKKVIGMYNDSIFVSKNNRFVGKKLNTAIFLSDQATLIADNNKFIKFKNAIETTHGQYEGKIDIKNIEIGHCQSSGLYIHGGIFNAINVNIYKSASGAIIGGNARGDFGQLTIKDNKFFGLDILSGAKVKVERFKFDKNFQAGIHASGNDSEITLLDGLISNSQTAFFSERNATIIASNINLKTNIINQLKENEGGTVKLRN